MKRIGLMSLLGLGALFVGGCNSEVAATDGSVRVDGGMPGLDSGRPPTDGCVTELAVICDGDDLSVRDLCTQLTTVVEACTGACYRGACVDCAPEAGRFCVGNEVHDIDSCGEVGVLIETCGSECRAGQCVGAECTSAASRRCIGDTIFTVDSCGHLEDAVRVCASGCADGACVGEVCTPDMFIGCYRGDVYNFDSCLEPGGLSENCPEACDPDTSMCEAGACTPLSSIACFLGKMHRMNSCGVTDEIAVDCPSGCNDSGCLPCAPHPVGNTCSEGDVHELIGGCPGAPATVGPLAMECEFGCSGGACLLTACTPNVGTVCSGGNVHIIDSCGVVGSQLTACSAGCAMGACLSSTDAGRPDAGPGDAGMAGTCTCTAVSGFPPFICVAGGSTIQCGGCYGFDDACDNESLCLNDCADEFTCVGGNVMLHGTTIANCETSPSACEALCGAPAP